MALDVGINGLSLALLTLQCTNVNSHIVRLMLKKKNILCRTKSILFKSCQHLRNEFCPLLLWYSYMPPRISVS